jgi:hypothetical protein
VDSRRQRRIAIVPSIEAKTGDTSTHRQIRSGWPFSFFFSSAFDDEGKESSASACWVQIEQRRRDGGMFRAPFLTVPGDAMSKPRLLAWRSLLAKAKFVWRRAALARPGQDMH